MMIVWNLEKMGTGVAEIDAQHQEWIYCFNEFGNAITQGRGKKAVEQTFQFFILYTEIHFKTEEVCMHERRCPAALENRAAHQRLRSMLSRYQKGTVLNGFSMTDVAVLRQTMAEWLVNHIMTIDTQLRGYTVPPTSE